MPAVAKFEKKGPLYSREILPLRGKPKVWQRDYVIPAPLEEVFSFYSSSHPARTWPEEVILFRCAYEPGSKTKISAADPWPGLKLGLKIFTDLGVRGLSDRIRFMVPVAVTAIETNRMLRYEYLEGAVTRGDNTVHFEAAQDESGRPITRIHHVCHYQPTSLGVRLVMPFCYEYIHGGFVDTLHAKMRAEIAKLTSR